MKNFIIDTVIQVKSEADAVHITHRIAEAVSKITQDGNVWFDIAVPGEEPTYKVSSDGYVLVSDKHRKETE